MSAKRLMVSLAALMVGAFSALIGSTAAQAADPCCDTKLSGPAHNVTAGGDASPFEFSVKNKTIGSYRNVVRSITIQLPDLHSNQVRLARSRDGGGMQLINLSPAGPGILRAIDGSQNRLDPLQEVISSYAIQFLSNSPNGTATLSVSVAGSPSGGRITVLGAQSTTLTITGGVNGSPSPSKKPSTKPSAAPSDVAVPLAPTDPTTTDTPYDPALNQVNQGLPWYAYGFGLVLLLGGAGLLAYLYFNRDKEGAEVEHDDPGRWQPRPAVYGGTAAHQPGYGGGYDSTGGYGGGAPAMSRGGRVNVYPPSDVHEPTQAIPVVTHYPPAVDPYDDGYDTQARH